MRLIWQSKIVSGSTVCPEDHRNQSANRHLAARLALRTASRRLLSPLSGFSLLRSLRFVIQLSPIASLITCDREGLASSSHRRGVTPLVLLLKRSGNISAKSLTVVLRNNSE